MGSTDSVSDLNDYAVILFDGVCNLCTGSVLFVIERDKKARFKFAPLQSPYAQQILVKHNITYTSPQSIFLIKDNHLFTKSNAALEIIRLLPGFWPVLYSFKIVPRFLRDFIYDLIAKNRYRFFGKADHCMVPTPELNSRFIAGT